MKEYRKENPRRSIEIEYLRISSDDLINILRKTDSNLTDINLTIGETFDDEYVILENMDEIIEHRSAIKIPFSVTISGVDLQVRSYGARVSYVQSERVRALSLANRLEEYRSPLRYFAPYYVLITSIVALYALFWSDVRSIFPIEVVGLTSILLVALIIVNFLAISGTRPRFHSKERKNIIIRNLDKIFIVIISVLFTTAISNFNAIVSLLFKAP